MRELALAIFAATYALLAIGRLRPFRLDRTGIAIIGAALMILSHVISLEAAAAAVDYRTLVLLFGMMILSANLRLSGFFELIAVRATRAAVSPARLLGMTIVVSGVLAAFFINDVVCVVLTPLLLDVTRRCNLRPEPFLLAVATASNIGSVATITGNPQNMLIASFSGVSYGSFAAHLTPIAVLGLLIDFGVLWVVYRGDLRHILPATAAVVRRRPHRPLLRKSVLTAVVTVVLFALGMDVTRVALGAGAFLLVTRRIRPERIYREIDWTLLVLFIGLFVVVGGLEATGIEREWMPHLRAIRLDQTVPLMLVTAALSNLVSNVPAVMLLKPFVGALAPGTHPWLTVAAASTLAGNLTPVASIANLIVLEQARRQGVHVSFGAYVRVGIPITILTLALAAGVLAVRS